MQTEVRVILRRAARHLLTAAALLSVLAPIPVSADSFFGVSFASVSPGRTDLQTIDNGSTTFGATVGSGGGQPVSFEIDFGYTSQFLGSPTDSGRNTLITIMPSLFAGPSIAVGGGGQAIRPYISVGTGLIRNQAENDFGWNAAGGVIAFLSNRVGIRGDVRYFHTVNNTDSTNTILMTPGGFHFWRGSLGIVVR
jgi:hypothetical protein